MGPYDAHVSYQRWWKASAWCHRHQLRRSARLGELLVRLRWSADLPPSLALRDDVVLMHNALGVVIHAQTTFAGPAVIMQHVTLGLADRRPGENSGAPRIGRDVVIGAGACILGPVTVGDGSVVGANSVVTRDVPSGHLASGNPAVVKPIRSAPTLPDIGVSTTGA
jgi:serine O-acetyltransferase